MSTESATKPSRGRPITFTSNPVVSIVLSVFLTIVLRLFVERFWSHLNGFWDVWWLRTTGTLLVFLVGGGLFLFRRYSQRAYGILEILFALTVSGISIAKAQTQRDVASWIAVIAAAYFIVRGLTNYQEGKKRAVADDDF